jgi:flagellar biosynthesis component FlhA
MDKNRYKQVDGSPMLFRDTHSGAIVNVNEMEVDRARKIKAMRKAKAEEFEQVKEDVQQMKSDLTDIKSLLQRLAENT